MVFIYSEKAYTVRGDVVSVTAVMAQGRTKGLL